MKQKEKLCLDRLELLNLIPSGPNKPRGPYLNMLVAKAWSDGFETFRAQAILQQSAAKNIGQLNLHILGEGEAE